MDKVGDYNFNQSDIDTKKMEVIDKWILHNLNKCVEEVNRNFDHHHYSDATTTFRTFWLDCFCDIYIENSKLVLCDGVSEERQKVTKAILFKVIETGMRLLHPMMPFLTEELYQKLSTFENKAKSVSIAPFPETNKDFEFSEAAESFDLVLEMLNTLRQSMGSINLPPKSSPMAYLSTENLGIKETVKRYFPL